MSKNHDPHHRIIPRRLVACGVFLALAAPTTVTAMPPSTETEPSAAMADPCAQSTVQIEVDVATGDLYLVDPNTGNWTPTDNDITVGFGSLGHVVIVIHYSTGNWTVSVTPNGAPTVTYGTTNSWMRYSISSSYDYYVFSSNQSSSASATASMVPVIPDIIIRTDNDCPPPP